MLSIFQSFIMTIAALIGAIGISFLGWLESGEPFHWRTFTSSLMRAGLAALVLAAASFSGVETEFSFWQIIEAIIMGAGIEVGVKRIAGAVKASTPQPSK